MFAPHVSAQLLTGYGDADAEIEVEAEVVPSARVQEDSGFLTRSAGVRTPQLPQEELLNVADDGDIQRTAGRFLSSPGGRLVSKGGDGEVKIAEDSGNGSPAPVSPVKAEDKPVDLQADDVSYDEDGRIVTASGNVIIVQAGRILRADKVQYDLNTDTVRADGNVVLNEVTGDIYFSDSVELTDGLKNGFVQGVEGTLNDGSYFTAVNGRRVDGNKTILKNATYTPCEICKDSEDKDKAPVWQIRASEVQHDEENADISYKHARFEIYGVPVAYTPVFSHPDGSIDQKNGFLSPSLGYKSSLGAFVENSYYWGIAEDKDLTLGLNAYTEEAPLATAQYRQRWQNASLILDGGVTFSERTDEEDGIEFIENEELRGFIFAEGLWDINEKWRSGLNVEYVSDDQFARQYDLTSKDVLEDNIYIERFSGRNYGLGIIEVFQDLRISELESDQPEVLPEITASFIGEPGQVPLIKGRWDAHLGFLSLFRNGDGQDVNRGSVDAGWERRLVSDYGLVSNIEASVRGDIFQINDSVLSPPGSGTSGDEIEARFFPQIHVESSYPVARNFEASQLVIEPIVSITAAPEVEENDDVPNEDSQDVQLDASNLFDPNRFPGLDVVEDESRVTYGVRSGLYGLEGSSLEGFVGQSYRFDEDGNPFAAGSGLDDQSSDVVGYVNGNYGSIYRLGYRFQLDNETLSSERHELDVLANWDRLRLNASYLFADPIEGADIEETREQIDATAAYYLNKTWRFRAGARHDLGEDPGLRRAFFGIDHFGCCVFWSLTGVRNLTDDASGDSSTEFLFRIGLKNLGDFQRSGLRDTDVSE